MKLNTKKTIFVGLAFLIICMFWQVYDNVVAKMLINTFGLNQTWSGVVLALDNVFAMFLLPIFGILSDKTKTKIGKRKPYILVGTILAAIFFLGVAIFDNIQMKNLVEQEKIQEVVEINEQNLEKYNLDGLDKDLILEKYEGYYYFSYALDDELLSNFYYDNNSLFNRNNLEYDIKSITKYFRLTEDDMPEEEFDTLCNNLLSKDDLSSYVDFFALSYEERIKLENGKRVYQETFDKLEMLIAEKILDSDNPEEILKECGIKEFYLDKEEAVQVRSVLAWRFTKNNIGYLIGFITVLLFTLVSMATFRTPAVSLMPDVTPKPLRSKANAIINLMGTVGGIISLILMSFLAKDYQSYISLFIVVGALMIVLLAIFNYKVDEPKLALEMQIEEENLGVSDENYQEIEEMPKEVKRSFILILLSVIFWFMAYNAATSKFSVYAGDVLNMGYTIPLLFANATAVISYIPIGIIASKYGRKKTVITGVLILMFAFVLGCIATSQTTFLIYLTMGLAGIGWATINVNSYPMVVEMSKGNNIGKYTGYYYTASMFAQIITPILSGLIMDLSNTMKVLFPYCVVFCILAFVTMSLVKHGDSKPLAKKNIEVYEELD